MPNYLLIKSITYFIGIAALICIFRYRRLHRAYLPFVWFCILATISEIISTICTLKFRNNAVQGNIYVLLEWILFIWLFLNWSTGKRRRQVYLLAGILMVLFWIVTTLITAPIYRYNSDFRVVYSLLLLSFAIDQFGLVITAQPGPYYKNPQFCILCAIVLFFTVKAAVEIFYILDIVHTRYFRFLLTYLTIATDFISNLIYVYVALLIPVKQKYMPVRPIGSTNTLMP